MVNEGAIQQKRETLILAVSRFSDLSSGSCLLLAPTNAAAATKRGRQAVRKDERFSMLSAPKIEF